MDGGEDYGAHPHWPLLVKAYARFRNGNPRAALDVLEPALVGDKTTQHSSLVTGLLWALAGDCYFKLDETEAGFAAYRIAIGVDPECGCLALYARQVARHGRAEEAELALECLDRAYRGDKEAWWQYPIHFMRWALKPGALYFRCVLLPLTRRRLRRLAAAHRSAE